METQSDKLEQQARRIRTEMSGTLDELRARITPGQVVDQLADYTRDGPPAEFTRNLGREIIENPLPLTLIAIGVAWLIIGSRRSSRARAEQSAAIKVAEIYDREASGTETVSREAVVARPTHRDNAGNGVEVVGPEIFETRT